MYPFRSFKFRHGSHPPTIRRRSQLNHVTSYGHWTATAATCKNNNNPTMSPVSDAAAAGPTFSSVPVVDVTADNLDRLIPDIRSAVSSATFVALDCVSRVHGRASEADLSRDFSNVGAERPRRPQGPQRVQHRGALPKRVQRGQDQVGHRPGRLLLPLGGPGGRPRRLRPVPRHHLQCGDPVPGGLHRRAGRPQVPGGARLRLPEAVLPGGALPQG